MLRVFLVQPFLRRREVLQGERTGGIDHLLNLADALVVKVRTVLFVPAVGVVFFKVGSDLLRRLETLSFTVQLGEIMMCDRFLDGDLEQNRACGVGSLWPYSEMLISFMICASSIFFSSKSYLLMHTPCSLARPRTTKEGVIGNGGVNQMIVKCFFCESSV